MLTPIFVWQNKLLKSIDPRQVICLMTEGNYTRVVVSDGKFYMVRSTLTGAMKKLAPEMFIRIHRSTVASVYFIDLIAKDHLLLNGELMPIGREYYKSVFRKLNIIK